MRAVSMRADWTRVRADGRAARSFWALGDQEAGLKGGNGSRPIGIHGRMRQIREWEGSAARAALGSLNTRKRRKQRADEAGRDAMEQEDAESADPPVNRTVLPASPHLFARIGGAFSLPSKANRPAERTVSPYSTVTAPWATVRPGESGKPSSTLDPGGTRASNSTSTEAGSVLTAPSPMGKNRRSTLPAISRPA